MRPVILVHGYSDTAQGFGPWRRLLGDSSQQPDFDVRVAEYKSLSNEISIKDIAEGFDRALRLQSGLGADEDFDAVVHSTGMLVIRDGEPTPQRESPVFRPSIRPGSRPSHPFHGAHPCSARAASPSTW